jgi:hypothetical protein
MLTPQPTYPNRLVATVLFIAAFAGLKAGAIYLVAHTPKELAFRSEWRCLRIPDADVCERSVKPL